MPPLPSITFSLTELLAILGLAQSLLLLVHITLRMTSLRAAFPYIAYFVMLTSAFVLHLAYRLVADPLVVDFIIWFVWSMTVPLSILMILSILLPGRRLRRWRYTVIAVVPVFTLATAVLANLMNSCATGLLCVESFQLFLSGGIIAQSLCFLWLADGKISRAEFLRQENSSERYWLIISFLTVNIALIGLSLWYLNDDVSMQTFLTACILLGLVFVYIISTLIFRVYPPALKLQKSASRVQGLPLELETVKDDIESLMKYDKLYQEPSFGRADLARELNLTEAQISNIINAGFGMNFAQYINGYRVKEARYLLATTHQSISDIAGLTGFNSIASFNRVFKDRTGQTPTHFRKTVKIDDFDKLSSF
ncbi:MAG: helix-turn-helix domain-containing protein [Pseudomonadota bacterium]